MFSVGKFLYELKVNSYAITATKSVDAKDYEWFNSTSAGQYLAEKGWYETPKTEEKVVFTFDTITEAEVRGSSNVVGYPIEKGYTVTDYKYQNPSTIHIVGVMERSSIVGNLARRATNKVLSKLGYKEYADPISKLVQDLEYYKSGLYPLNIQTKSGLYKKYTLTDYTIPENFDNYGLLEVEMTFQQIMTTDDARPTSSNQDTIEGGLAKVTKKLTGGLIGG